MSELNKDGKRSSIPRFSSRKLYRLRSELRCKRFSRYSREKDLVAFSLGTRPGDAGDEQDAFDNRQRALFGSILRGPAAQWYQGLAANLPWNEIRDQFIDRFTDDKDKYRRRIEAENIKRQPDEFIKSYIHRLSTAVDRGWPNPTFNDDQRTAKKMEFFVRGLSPPGLKQKAHQFLIHPQHGNN